MSKTSSTSLAGAEGGFALSAIEGYLASRADQGDPAAPGLRALLLQVLGAGAGDGHAPEGEGWDLFDYDGTGLLEIQRDDEQALFDSDDQALQYVTHMAEYGSKRHVEALAKHRKDQSAIAALRGPTRHAGAPDSTSGAELPVPAGDRDQDVASLLQVLSETQGPLSIIDGVLWLEHGVSVVVADVARGSMVMPRGQGALVHRALAAYREMVASTESADRAALGSIWADAEVAACDALLANLPSGSL